ncbi:MAG: AMP-binding protein, partial [Pseudomonadota bacterium]
MHKTIVTLLEDDQKNENPAYLFFQKENQPLFELSYRQLYLMSLNIGEYLASQGAKYNDVVIISVPPGIDYITSLFACLLKGYIPAPVYPAGNKYAFEKLAQVVLDSGAKFIIIPDNIKTNFPQLTKDIEAYKLINAISTNDMKDFTLPSNAQPTLVDENKIAFLQYTSGSTGKPKGVMISHGNLIHNLEAMKSTFEFKTNTY